MHYEGARTIEALTPTQVDVFALTQDVLNDRWIKLITVFGFLTSTLRVPDAWFGAAFELQRGDKTLLDYYARVKVLMASYAADGIEMRQLILGVLKVRRMSIFLH